MPLNIPHFSDDYVEDRWVELCQVFYDFRDSYQRQIPDVEICLDDSKLFLATVAYFHDVSRYKWWHYRNADGGPEVALLHATKQAAFLSYWINRIGPVYVLRKAPSRAVAGDGGYPSDPSLICNVHFALFVALLYLDYSFSPKLLSKLIYQLLWREGSPRAYILLFETLQEIRDGEELFSVKTLADFGSPG